MKTLYFVLFCFFSYGQKTDFVTIEYKFLLDQNFKEDKDLKNENPEVKKNVIDFIGTYDFMESNLVMQLKYNKQMALFKAKNKIMPPDSFNSMQVASLNSIQNSLIFISLLDSTVTKNISFNGKNYNVNEKYPQWQITTETIMIQDFLCFKAVLEDNPKIVAWFTPDLNFSIGPRGYAGLPGLILQLDTGYVTLVCKQISFEPFDPAEIQRPKGVEISKAEMDELYNRARRNRM
jgi:GLPGLI family protein